MKKLNQISFFLLIGATLLLSECTDKNMRHIGEWTGTDNSGKSAKLILDKNNNATLIIGTTIIGGDNMDLVKGRKVEFKYVIDYTKDPIWLDLLISDKETKDEIERIKGIVKFINDDKIEYRSQVNSNDNRFEKFDPTDSRSTVFLERKVK